MMSSNLQDSFSTENLELKPEISKNLNDDDDENNSKNQSVTGSSPFYAIKILSLPPTTQLDSLTLKFLKEKNLNSDDLQLIRRTSDNEITHNFIEFFHNKQLLDDFIEFFKIEESVDLDYELIDNEIQLNYQLPGHLFIRGLLYTTTAQDLYNIFKPYGEIHACKVIFNDYGISKGFGFINFSNKVEADNAIESLNGCNVDGNNLFINHHVSKKDRLKELEYKMNKFSNIYIKNLPADVTKVELSDLFGKFGKINSIFLPKDLNHDVDIQSNIDHHEHNSKDVINDDVQNDGSNDKESEDNPSSKAYGFINFKYHEDAINARKEMNGFEIRPGYNIQIDRAERKKERIQYESLAHHFNINTNKICSSDNDSTSSATITRNIDNSGEFHRMNKDVYEEPRIEKFQSPIDRSFSFSSNSSSRSRRQSSITSPQILPSFAMVNGNFNYDTTSNHNYHNFVHNQSLKNSNQRLQYPQMYQPIIPFTYNHKNKSQELLLQPEKQLQKAYQQQQQQQVQQPVQSQPQHIQESPYFANNKDNVYDRKIDHSISMIKGIPMNNYQPSITNQNPVLPPFIITPDSNLISTSTGLPIAGPQFQDSNLYVIHLPKEYSDEDLYGLFEKYGKITSSRVITYQPEEVEQLNKKKKYDRAKQVDSTAAIPDAKLGVPEDFAAAQLENDNSASTENQELNSDADRIPLVGESKCFGFVCFQNPVDASKALVCMNGFKVDSNHVLRVTFAQRKENKYNQGRLHHYNQNHLGGLYQYVNNYNNSYAHIMTPSGNIPPMPASSIPSLSPMGAMPAMGPIGPVAHLGPMAHMAQMAQMAQMAHMAPIPPSQLPPSTSPSLPTVAMQHSPSIPSMNGVSNVQSSPAMEMMHGVSLIGSNQHQPQSHYYQQQPPQYLPQNSPQQAAIPAMNSIRLSGITMMNNTPGVNKYNNWYYPSSYHQGGSSRERYDEFQNRQMLDVENGMQDLTIGLSDEDDYENYEEYEDYENYEHTNEDGDMNNDDDAQVESVEKITHKNTSISRSRIDCNNRRNDANNNFSSTSNNSKARSKYTRANSYNSHSRRNYNSGSNNSSSVDINQNGYYNYNYYDHNYGSYVYNRGNYKQHNRSHSMINSGGFGSQKRQERRE